MQDIVDSTIADVGDLCAVEAIFARAQPEVVFHLAAQPIVRISYAEPVATYITNVTGTVNVLEAAQVPVRPCGCGHYHRQVLRESRVVARISRTRSTGRK
ncbi:MAG: GDP-mannose 4,6-dehydratase [Actinomycetota bacterium]|nr:GDP-mannose 4,6-dehydratase [Actinomycetota bacterium]